MKTIQLEINFPLFEGFYNSYLDLSENIEVGEGESYSMTEEQFDEIDWKATNNNVSKFYLNYFKDELKDFFNEIGIINLDFVKVDSPKYYNYSTDKLVCNIQIDKNVFVHELRKYNFEAWRQFLKNNFTSYDGFISFYPNDPNEWAELITEKFEDDNVIIETLLQFYLEQSEEFRGIKENLFTNIFENTFELLEY